MTEKHRLWAITAKAPNGEGRYIVNVQFPGAGSISMPAVSHKESVIRGMWQRCKGELRTVHEDLMLVEYTFIASQL